MAEGVVKFGRVLGLLKSQRRAGWVLSQVPCPESIADHMYRMAILSFLGGSLEVDEDHSPPVTPPQSDDDDTTRKRKREDEVDEGGDHKNQSPPQKRERKDFPENSQSSSSSSNKKKQRRDVTHMIKLSLVHDLCEALAGDITPLDGISQKEKLEKEREAMKVIEEIVSEEIGLPDVGKELVSLWEEYDANQTNEAKFVKDLDKFDMILQADEYEREHNIDLNQFFQSTEGKIQTPQVLSWVTALRKEREEKRKEKETNDSSSSKDEV